MHTRRPISTLAIGLAMVFVFDYATMAATGQSLILGQVNKANQPTVVERTTPGPAVTLKSKPGSAPLSVNRGAKVNKLNADRVDGVDGSQLAKRSTVSTYEPPRCAKLTNVTTSFQKLTNIATFTKQSGDSSLRLELLTRLLVQSMTASGVIYQLRVDDAATTFGSAGAVYVQENVGEQATIPILGVFRGVPAGQHTVSVWVRGYGGSGTNAMIDPGCWDGMGVNQLLVTEFH